MEGFAVNLAQYSAQRRDKAGRRLHIPAFSFARRLKRACIPMETIVRTIMPDRKFLGHVFKLAFAYRFPTAHAVVVVLRRHADVVGGKGKTSWPPFSLATQFQFLFSLFTAALTLGMSILVAQYWGAGNRDAVERVLGFVMLYAGMLSTAFFLAALLVPEQLMSIMTNDGTLIMLGARYLRISSLSYLFIGLSQMYLCLMKNTGLAVMGMTVSTVGVIVHVVLNAALIYGIGSLDIPALGIFRRGYIHGDFACD